MMGRVASPSTNLTHAECRTRAESLELASYDVALDLSRAADPDAGTFPSRSTVAFTATGGDTWIDLIAERVVAARLNGRELDVAGYDGARLAVPGLADGPNELVVEAECRYSRSGEGLHRFVDPVDDATYLYTHFEPTDARRVFANFEQPDLKARFTFVVTAPRDWQIVSGQREAARTDDDNGSATVTFAPTPHQSGYLTAVAAGPYHRVEDLWASGDQKVPLGVLCRASMAEHLEPDAIFTVTRQGLDFYDQAFGFPYPWGKYDSIFVPEYNLGAMENPGLVTFTEGFIHRGAATRADRARRAEVILHEMAHMWFGDLVTPRWWDGTWLKESFADLMGYHVTEVATEFDGAWTTFAGRRKAWAYRQDQLPTTHPIVATVDDLEAARQNFDGITYAKGASVLKQLMAYVGEAEFFAGARDYFARHAYGNTELADLLDCLERSSGRDLQAWSRAWLETSGISRLDPVLETGLDGRITRLAVTQTATDPVTGASVDRPHRVVIGLYEPVDGGLQRVRSIETDVVGARTELAEAVGGPAALVLVNDDDLSYAKVRLDAGSLAAVREHLATIPASLSRALVWSALWNATRDAELPASEYLDVAFHQAGREPAADLLGHGAGRGRDGDRELPAHRTATCRALTPRGHLPRRAPRRGARVGHPAHLGPAPDARRDRQCGRHRHGARPARRQRAARGPHGRRRPALGLLGGAGRTGCGDVRRARRGAGRGRHDDRPAGPSAGDGEPTRSPRGHLAARDDRRVAHQRPVARPRPGLQPARRPPGPGLRRALLRLDRRLVGRAHHDHGDDPGPRAVPRRFARRRTTPPAAPGGPAGPRLAA